MVISLVFFSKFLPGMLVKMFCSLIWFKLYINACRVLLLPLPVTGVSKFNANDQGYLSVVMGTIVRLASGIVVSASSIAVFEKLSML